MNTKLEFKDGNFYLSITPDDEWEKTLIGAVAKGKGQLSASIQYESDGHFSYGKCKAVKIIIYDIPDEKSPNESGKLQ